MSPKTVRNIHNIHGTLTKRAALYTELTRQRRLVEELQTRLCGVPEFIEWNEARMSAARLWKEIKGSVDQENELFKNEDFC
jgi:hypothetical protein